jgi:hypothetical protein
MELRLKRAQYAAWTHQTATQLISPGFPGDAAFEIGSASMACSEGVLLCYHLGSFYSNLGRILRYRRLLAAGEERRFLEGAEHLKWCC